MWGKDYNYFFSIPLIFQRLLFFVGVGRLKKKINCIEADIFGNRERGYLPPPLFLEIQFEQTIKIDVNILFVNSLLVL